MKKIVLTVSAVLLALNVSISAQAGGSGHGGGDGFFEDPFFEDKILPNLHKSKKTKQKQSLSSTYDGTQKSKAKK